MEVREELKKEIERLREKLNKASQDKNLTKNELLEISQKLDELINQYYE